MSRVGPERSVAGLAAVSVALGAVLAALAGCSGDTGQLELRWTIGGLLPPSARGDPWVGVEASLDSCAEVDATNVLVRTLSGPDSIAEQPPCSTSQGQRHVFTDVARGRWELSVALLDKAGERLTREQRAVVEVNAVQGLARVDFAPSSFRDTSGRAVELKGNYRFTALYEGRTCDDVADPQPSAQTVRLLDQAGRVVRAQLCAGRTCISTTGRDAMPCVPAATTQRIEGLAWGQYTLELAAQSQRGAACWEARATITVGAGENPTIEHDLAPTTCPR